jgi:gas vesicle protein
MKFVWGLLLGLGLGVIIGLLVAPQTGEDTLALLREQGVQLRSGSLNDQIRSRANEAMTQGRELYSRTKDDLTDRYSKAKSGNL